VNTYKVTAPREVLDHEPGSTFEHEFTADEEADMLDNGRLELVPREYEVVGTSVVHGAKPGGKFKGALRVREEAALILGGHIERVAKKSATSGGANNGGK
jgi:hypothetical protein